MGTCTTGAVGLQQFQSRKEPTGYPCFDKFTMDSRHQMLALRMAVSISSMLRGVWKDMRLSRYYGLTVVRLRSVVGLATTVS